MAELTQRQMLDAMDRAVTEASRLASIRYGLDRHPKPHLMTDAQKVAAEIRWIVTCFVEGVPFERRVAMPEAKRMSPKKILAIFRSVVEESSHARGPAPRRSKKPKVLAKAPPPR
jgi:hypothetical protein